MAGVYAVQVSGDCIKGHCIMEPGLKRDIWIDLVDANCQRLTSSNGKGASLLVNLSYEPLQSMASPPRPAGDIKILEASLDLKFFLISLSRLVQKVQFANPKLLCGCSTGPILGNLQRNDLFVAYPSQSSPFPPRLSQDPPRLVP